MRCWPSDSADHFHANSAALILLLLLLCGIGLNGAAADKPAKVFILAGQSNMEGKAPNALFDHQATDPKTKDLFAHLRQGDRWAVRDDVFIKFLERKGPLTLGYGSPGRTGPELEFGTRMGDRFEEPVILIKAAWGDCVLFPHLSEPLDPKYDGGALVIRKMRSLALERSLFLGCSERDAERG